MTGKEQIPPKGFFDLNWRTSECAIETTVLSVANCNLGTHAKAEENGFEQAGLPSPVITDDHIDPAASLDIEPLEATKVLNFNGMEHLIPGQPIGGVHMLL